LLHYEINILNILNIFTEIISMAPPINVQDWYGDRHTCQIASGALVCDSAGSAQHTLQRRHNVFTICPVVCLVPPSTRPQGGRVHYTHAATEASYDRGRS